MQASNLGWLSHIVAASPDGPRGDPERSSELAADINNLMLTCRDHGKVIDDSALIDEYPEELLRQFKREHERRVKLVTGMGPDSSAHVVIVRVAVRGTSTSITSEEAHRALLPLFPAEEQPREIDLSQLTVPASNPAYLQLVAEALDIQLRAHQLSSASHGRLSSVALFALAPIPILMFLGWRLGNLRKVHLFQRHPKSQSWRWPERQEELKDFFEKGIPSANEIRPDRAIALLLSTSSPIGRERIRRILNDPVIYEIRAKEPSRDFLESPSRLEMFGVALRDLFEQLRSRHPQDTPIHVFAAVQAPIAIEFGRNVRPNDPPFVVYEYDDGTRTYSGSLTINR